MNTEDLTTVLYTEADHVATITLNRPQAMNSFNQRMLDEFEWLWKQIRLNDDIHAVVIRASGERAFSTGADVKEGIFRHPNPWTDQDPTFQLCPKQNRVWKPVVACVHGMAAAGAFYFLNEADIIICSEDATFFDPHVSYGLTAVLEPIGLTRRIPLGEALRIALLGLDERMSAARALQIGLVSEVLPRESLWERGAELAALIAAKPPAAVQGTVRAIWESLDSTRSQAIATGMGYTLIGNPLGTAQVDRASVSHKGWNLR